MECQVCGKWIGTDSSACAACGGESNVYAAPRAVVSEVVIEVAQPVLIAALWKRVVAAAIDLFMLNYLCMATDWAWILYKSRNGMDDYLWDNGWLFEHYILRGLVAWLYLAGLECSVLQATVGKLALRIGVGDIQGRQISFVRASVRSFVKVASYYIWLISFGMAYATVRRQSLHDKVARTVVMDKPW